MNKLINMAQKELIPLEINDMTLPVDLIQEIKGSIYVAKDPTYENINQALWRGRFYHFGKIDEKKEQEIMRIAIQSKWGGQPS